MPCRELRLETATIFAFVVGPVSMIGRVRHPKNKRQTIPIKRVFIACTSENRLPVV